MFALFCILVLKIMARHMNKFLTYDMMVSYVVKTYAVLKKLKITFFSAKILKKKKYIKNWYILLYKKQNNFFF